MLKVVLRHVDEENGVFGISMRCAVTIHVTAPGNWRIRTSRSSLVVRSCSSAYLLITWPALRDLATVPLL